MSVGWQNGENVNRLDECGDVLVLDELGDVLRISTRTIKRRLRAGTCPIRALHGLDRKWRWAKADVEKYLRRDKLSAV